MLDQFRVVRELGRGGMGVVYEGEDTLLRRRVAIKVIPSTSNTEVNISGLLREARATAQLDHANVLRVYHIGKWDAGFYLVLELVSGGSLHDRLASGALPWAVATGALCDACKGLSAAHAAGLIHRDIKPANLMCGPGGVKVADFGLARGGSLTTTEGLLAGTPFYMSPEQCRGERADERSDIYALGATYFHLLTGRPPFVHATPAQVMFAHCTRQVADPRSVVADLPEECAAVVKKAMAKDPADRYQTAEAMLAALAALAVPAQMVRTAPPERRGAGRRRWVLAVCAALLALGVGAGIFAWGRLGPPRPDELPLDGQAALGNGRGLDAPFDPVIPRDGRVIPCGGKVSAVAVSLDGKLLAAGVEDPALGATVWNFQTGKVRRRLRWGRVFSLAFHHPPKAGGSEGTYLLGGCAKGAVGWSESANKNGFMISGWKEGYGSAAAVGTKPGRWAVGYSGGGEQGLVHHFQFRGSELNRNNPLGARGGPPVRQLAYSPSDDLLAITFGDGKALVADTTTNKPVWTNAPGPRGEAPTPAVTARATDGSRYSGPRRQLPAAHAGLLGVREAGLLHPPSLARHRPRRPVHLHEAHERDVPGCAELDWVCDPGSEGLEERAEDRLGKGSGRPPHLPARLHHLGAAPGHGGRGGRAADGLRGEPHADPEEPVRHHRQAPAAGVPRRPEEAQPEPGGITPGPPRANGAGYGCCAYSATAPPTPGTAGATASPQPSRPCAASSSKTPAASRPSSAAASGRARTWT
jgi:hypothetical protein